MAWVVSVCLFLFVGALSSVESIYDPHHTNSDPLNYTQNHITDVDENSILSHGTTCPPNVSGQFPYAMDCRQFLNCWNGSGTIQSCAPGTLFNPRSLECDHPSKVKCKSFEEYTKPTAEAYAAHYRNEELGNGGYGQTTTTAAISDSRHYHRVQCQNGVSGLFAHPADCRKFLNCNHGATVIQDCGPGTAFNSITKVCDWPQNVDCGSRALPDGGKTDTSDSSDGEDIHHGEDQIDVRFSNRQHSHGAGNYHQTGYRGAGSYANSGDGSVDLNAQTSSVNHQYAPNPAIPQSLGVPNARSYSQNQPSLHQPRTSFSNIRQNGGAGGDQAGGAVPHVAAGYSTSATYSSSVNAQEAKFTNSHAGFDAGLSENQVLDDDEQQLKHEQTPYSPSKSIYGNINKAFLEKAGTGEKPNKSYGASIHVQSADKIKCRKEVTGLFVHPLDCSKYINCKNGRTDIQDCGPGTVFNARSGECDWPKNVQCNQKKPEEYFAARKSGRYEDVAAAADGDYENGSASSDSGYSVYEDEANSTVEPESPYNVGAFDYGGQDEHGRRIKCEKYASGLFPHPTNCKKFLHCDNGRTFIQDCGPGTAFNAELQVCDWPKNVDCGDRQYDGEARRTETRDEEAGSKVNTVNGGVYDDGTASEHVSPDRATITVNRSSKPYVASNSYSQIRRHHGDHPVYLQGGGGNIGSSSSEPGARCSEGMSGLNEHPSRCDQFLNCDGGSTIVQDCAPGTLFNPIVKICDFPNNVMCGNRGVPARTQPPSVGVEGTSSQDSYPNVPSNVFNNIDRENGPVHTRINSTNDPNYNFAMPPLIRSDPPKFNFSDQNVDNLRRESVQPNQWATKTSTANTPNAIGGTDKNPHTFAIPDMSKVPLAEFPGNQYPAESWASSANANTYNSNKRVSHGGDVPTEDFDLQSTKLAGIWPFIRHPDTNADSSNTAVVEGDQYDATAVLPMNRNRTKLFSAGREHITPIYFRPTTTPAPAVPAPTHAANYNKAYYKPTTEKPLTPEIQTDYLPLSEALKILMRPYISKNVTTDMKDVPVLHHTRTMEEKILNMADKKKDYRTDHTVSLEQESLASVDFEQATIRFPEPNSDDETLVKVTTPAAPRPNNEAHDENCNHYHPPHIHRTLRPNFGHSPEFHKHNPHWASGPTNQHPNSFADTTNNGYKPISGSNFHHSPHFHHRHHHNHVQHGLNIQHDPDHPYHRNHPVPHNNNNNQHHNTRVGPNHPNFQHDPNHPYHRNHPIHTHHSQYPGESTSPETSEIETPDIDIRFGNDQHTEPSHFPRGQTVLLGATNAAAPFTCNQFDCQNGLCLPFNKVCDGRNDCGNRLDELTCDHVGYEVRLTDDRGRKHMGRVEVKAFGRWGYVCDDKFGMADANVLCRELGYPLGASEVKSNSYYTPQENLVDGANTFFNMDEVNCRGNETTLKECDFSGWGMHDCNEEEVVGVICKVPVMTCMPEYWLCETSSECIPMSFMCDNVHDCSDGSDEAPQHCNATLEYRLVGGDVDLEGRVEVKYQDVWGTVCDDDFGDKEAYVFCSTLGFTGPASVTKRNFGKATGPIWLDQVSCSGNETALDKCMHFAWGETNCNHAEDVSVKCSRGEPRIQQKFSNPTDDIHAISTSDTEIYLAALQRNSKSVADDAATCGQIRVSDDGANQEPGEFRVISGTRTKRGYHPWQATIRAKGRNGKSSHWCGAVVISKSHILTAAHCLIGFPKGAYLIRLGDHHSEIAEDSEVEVFIENWIIHEDFRKGQHMNNDIAVILLKSPIQFTNYIQPVCMPPRNAVYEPGRNCTISGWGSIQYGKSTPSLDLKAGSVPIIDQNICRNSDIYGDAIMDGMFCAGYLGEEGVDACDGDSGGPIVCNDGGAHTLYGLISWGQRCGDSTKPGVYVRITSYLDWIQQKINLLNGNSSSNSH